MEPDLETLPIRETDALVLGGGPAGAAAAIVLAQAGHRVTLLKRSPPPEASLAQSVPPSARPLLVELGLAGYLDAGGFVGNDGNTVAWAGRPVREETFEAGARGYHVDREGLESVLEQALVDAGIDVRPGVMARASERRGGFWQVSCVDQEGGSPTLAAPWVIDATGRHGFLARHLGRVVDERTSTLALFGRWRAAAAAADGHPGHTVIESRDRGWIWSVPVADGERCVTAMIDPALTPLDGEPVGARLRSELTSAGLFRAMGERFTLIPGSTHACPATLYTSRRYTEDGLVLAGDAASFIDPLSSYGVKKALASGRLAGIVVSTALSQPSMTAHACRLHEAQEMRMAAEYRARAGMYFDEAAAAHGSSFWKERAEAARSAAQGLEAVEGLPDPLRGEPDVPPEAVRAIHARMRSAPSVRTRLGPTLAVVQEPALAGRGIVVEKHLTSGRHPAPVRRFRSVDLRELVRLAPEHTDVSHLWTEYQRSMGPVDLAELVTALSVVCAAGFLELEDG